MTGLRQVMVVKGVLVFLSLAVAPVARAQPQTSPPPPTEAAPDQPDGAPPAPAPSPAASAPPAAAPPPAASAPPGGYPPAYAAPPGYAPPPPYPAPGYPGPPGYYYYPGPYAQAPAPGVETHDGFYLRLQLGLGYATMSSSSSGTDRSIAGAGTGFDIALGAALNRHLVVYGTIIDSTAPDADFKLSGQPPDSAALHGRISGTVDVGGFKAAGVVAIGGGAAYYFDSNLFLAGSLLGSRMFVDDSSGHRAAESSWGFTLEGQVGKEWWVSDNWGLGVCGRVLLGAMKDQPLAGEDVPTWKLAAFSALFSATYN